MLLWVSILWSLYQQLLCGNVSRSLVLGWNCTDRKRLPLFTLLTTCHCNCFTLRYQTNNSNWQRETQVIKPAAHVQTQIYTCANRAQVRTNQDAATMNAHAVEPRSKEMPIWMIDADCATYTHATKQLPLITGSNVWVTWRQMPQDPL